MNQHIRKWGNSAAVRIPAATLEAAGLRTDDAVDVREENGRVVIEKAMPQPVTLDWLLEGISADNVHPEVDWGRPVGREFC